MGSVAVPHSATATANLRFSDPLSLLLPSSWVWLCIGRMCSGVAPLQGQESGGGGSGWQWAVESDWIAVSFRRCFGTFVVGYRLLTVSFLSPCVVCVVCVQAMKAVVVSVLLLCVVAAMGVRAADIDSETEAEVESTSQAELDASHENMVSTLEEYADKAHQLRDEIISTEHSLMEQMASIDTCPAGELAGLMARAKKQITHLFQIKSLYLAIKQQEAQLRELVDAGTGKRVPKIAPSKPAPQAPKPKPAAAKPAAAAIKPAAAAASSVAPANYAQISAMNTALHNALARLEKVVCIDCYSALSSVLSHVLMAMVGVVYRVQTGRLAKVEERSEREKKATLLIAGQMEKDEKRLNLHARVLRRLRAGAKSIKKSYVPTHRSHPHYRPTPPITHSRVV